MSGSAEKTPALSASVVTIGFFDGVHRGHKAIISAAVQRAQAMRLPSVAVTFDRHPQSVLQTELPAQYLCPLATRLRLLLDSGVQHVLVIRFDLPFASLSPDEFVHKVLKHFLNARHVVVGRDFRFGNQRKGDVEYLQQVQHLCLFTVEAVPDVLYQGERISSSRIRQALLEGKVEEANAMLGRAYILEGVVVKGRQLGRRLGYPTANLSLPFSQLVPRDGVYAGTLLRTRTGSVHVAAISVGVRPTVGGDSRTIEAYLLNFSGELYGEEVQLAFHHRLRDEVKFESIDALKAQMDTDIQQVAKRVVPTGGR